MFKRVWISLGDLGLLTLGAHQETVVLAWRCLETNDELFPLMVFLLQYQGGLSYESWCR